MIKTIVTFAVACIVSGAASQDRNDIKFYNLEKEYKKTVTHVYQVKNTSALELKQIVKDMLSIYGVVYVNDKTNELYVTDLEEKINDITPILVKLDNDSLKTGDNLVSRIITLKYENASDMLTIVRHKLSPEGKIFVAAQLNALTITDVPSKIDEVAALIKQLDVPTKHISIDITIVEFNSEKFSKLGLNVFNWLQNMGVAGQYNGSSQTDILNNGSLLIRSRQKIPGLAPTLAPPSPDGALLPKHISAEIAVSDIADFICDNADGAVLANTRLVTKNNKEAYISALERIPIRNTEHDLMVSDPWDHFVDAGILVNVLPSVQQDSLINLVVEPRISDLTGWGPKGTPLIFERSLKTEIIAKNNSVFVLGGLKKREKAKTRIGIPFLKDIPGLGLLFGVTQNVVLEREVLIFLRPTTNVSGEADQLEANRAMEESKKKMAK
jgi:type II secretory pathway component GspD/PulD (secretin)